MSLGYLHDEYLTLHSSSKLALLTPPRSQFSTEWFEMIAIYFPLLWQVTRVTWNVRTQCSASWAPKLNNAIIFTFYEMTPRSSVYEVRPSSRHFLESGSVWDGVTPRLNTINNIIWPRTTRTRNYFYQSKFLAAKNSLCSVGFTGPVTMNWENQKD